VSAGNPRHGRRDNGLYAANYAPVADVDPRVGEHLLDVLGNRGIAAYLQPSSDQNPVTRLTTLPGRPTDRLFVDRSELDTAREFLEILANDADELNSLAAEADRADAADDTDEATARAATSTTRTSGDTTRTSGDATRTSDEFEDAWASIVAGFHQTTGAGPAPWPAIEDIGPATPVKDKETPEPKEYPRWTGPAADASDAGSILDGLDAFGTGLDDDDEDFHPPVPPPLPRLAAITVLGILGVLAGIVIVIEPDLLPLDSTTAEILGCLCLVGGAIALIGRLRSGTDDDGPDDPDHGAVV
jgi:hypothetical protein